MILTTEERKKFIEWCRQEESSCKILLEQMAKLGLPEQITKMQRIRMMASKVVGDTLESVEVQTINAVPSEDKAGHIPG